MNELRNELERLETERARPDLSEMDTWSAVALVERILADAGDVAPAVARTTTELAAAVDAVEERLAAGGRLIYVGAGTPGRLAVVDASECPPTFGTPPEQVVAVIAGGPVALSAAVEGAEDDRAAAANDLRAIDVSESDAVVGISASGRTPYVLSAMDTANAAGAVTIGVSNNPGTKLSAVVDIAVETLTGPEFVAGSTRLKAGTAQKLVLNALSTAAMVRLGKTHGNLMVDVRATNEKLQVRARRIVVEATGADEETAARALDEADGHAKTAIVAVLAEVDAAEAARRLRATDGRVREALRERT